MYLRVYACIHVQYVSKKFLFWLIKTECSFRFILSVLIRSVNRRMDEWVTVERVDVERGPVEETPKDTEFTLESINGRERKVTRNLKRKHDEINHVQKVI